MATISVVFDTKTKELKADIDGKSVENLIGVEMYPSWDDQDEFRCSLMTQAEDEATDIKVFTRMVASETPAGSALLAAAKAHESVSFPGFVEAREDGLKKTHKDIAGFFGVG